MNAREETIHAPADEAEAAEIVRAAAARGAKLDIIGGGTRHGLGRPSEGGEQLSTRGLTGIVFHEPAEMTLRVRAGTTLREVEAALAPHGQMLPFEPIDHRALYGGEGEPTIGGLVATNASGPRRISAGAARDSLIGVRLVNGRGECVMSGGRVMKNVTGLDLVKLVCGAHGALGLVTEATFKLLPTPQSERTVVIRRIDGERAIAAMTQALGSPYGVIGATAIGAGMGRDFPRVFVRLEGFEDSLEARSERLIARLAEFGAKHALQGEESQRLWRAVRDVEFLAEPRERAVWRISLQPSKGARFIAALGAHALDHLYDWGGGLVWLASEPTIEAASAVRAALAPLGGHATLMRAPDELRARVDVFEPPAPALARLTKSVTASFDPHGVFNPGRMYAGI
ncbi:MAG TPA: glycolate oxidase subunit GlcE [Roseiarcus sp.]